MPTAEPGGRAIPGPGVEAEPATARRAVAGWAGRLITALAVGLSAYALYWVVGIVETRAYRISFLLVALVLTFLLYPRAGAGAGEPRSGAPGSAAGIAGGRPSRLDGVLAGLSVAALGWPLLDLGEFPYRAATPTALDLALGSLAIALVLEATRRTVGWILPVTALLFLFYAWIGPVLELVGLGAIAHRGYYPDRLIGSQYMTLEGMFGVPLDVAATYIILFTIYGSVLERAGASRFFIDWAMALTGRARTGAGPGRTITTAGFLLGSVSGSGVATTVTLGSVGWPLLRRAGYPADTGGAILAAAGIGAILSPPTLGAAAFLIAEFLQISYLEVLVMAVVPTVLYYLSALLMIEADSRRLGTRPAPTEAPPLGRLTLRYGYHFISLAAIVALMAFGMTAFRAVFWAIVLAAALSWIRPETRLGPRGLVQALDGGARGVLAVTATTATAGVIVGVVTLTGLGLKLSGLIVQLAGGSALATVALAAVAVWLLGLAVPVTASYIIAAVMIAPALTAVGIPAFAAHMFIFYYAVLSEVSPPTALSPFAAAAITGGNPFRTMMLTWKYTLPAFLVPFVFTLGDEGAGLLLRAPASDAARVALTAAAGVAALAAAFGGWLLARATTPERAVALGAGLLLLLSGGWTDAAGFAALAALLLAHRRRIAGAAAERKPASAG